MANEVVRQRLEDLLKQMLLVFAKESTALKTLSGKQCGISSKKEILET